MIKVGVTGGIGSGKSTVCLIFEKLGIPVFYADDQAKNILRNNEQVKEKIIKLFGTNAYLPSGEINKSELSSRVFNDKNALKDLNAIVHPAVKKYFDSWLAHQQSPYIIKEAAILFESGAHKEMDFIIAVAAPKDIRIQRVIKRDKTTREQVEMRMANQLTDDDRAEKSNFVIVNDDQKLLTEQVLEIHRILIKQ
jgi:dephospho-CoA kinase